jgi:hypothetical protein
VAEEESKKALIVVRTYPVPATKGIEVSCTAAITDKGEWLRIFPVPWRFLDNDERFKKYQWVELHLTKATGDSRPESYRLKQAGIKILSSVGTENNWKERKELIFPMRSHCLCCLVRERDARGHPTLGIFRPKKIESLIISSDQPDWSQAELAKLRQIPMFSKAPKTELEKIPFKFQYKFWCEDQACKGHQLACTDWEMGQSWRRWREEYGDQWEGKFRNRFEKEMIEKYDTHFYVGTIHQHPHIWIIVGLFYPPHSQPGLFELPPKPYPQPTQPA